MDMKDFLNVLASKEPVPGGGGACGYVAAVGMVLGNMVLSLKKKKKKMPSSLHTTMCVRKCRM